MKCPGQDMQYWKDDAIYEVKCPDCEKLVEFYKDDTTRKCNHCGHRFVNPKMDFGCASYCQFAEQCLGTLPEEFVLQQDNLLKDKVAVAMKHYFKNDFKRISQATKTARYAEKIAKTCQGTNMAVILCSAYLLNIGYLEAAQKSDNVSTSDLQQEGPKVAITLLTELGAAKQLIGKVIQIIQGERGSDPSDQTAFNIVTDAQTIMLLEEEQKNSSIDLNEIRQRIERLREETSRNEALAIFS